MTIARLCCIAALCAAALAMPARAQRVDPADAVTLALRNAVTFNPNGTQHVRLVALRALKDPSMRPMFEALLKADEAPLRLDGLFGLAELAGERGADPEAIRAIGDPAVRTVAITECLGLGVLKPEGIRSILAWPDLPAYDRTLLVAELNRLHAPWEITLVGDATNSTTAEVAGLAALLALERGDDTPWKAIAAKLAQLDAADRTDLLRRLADASRHYELARAIGPLLEATGASQNADRLAAIAAALAWDKPRGREALLALVQADRSAPNLTQCGLLMLAGGDTFKAEDFALLQGSEGIAQTIGAAGAAVRSGSADVAPALTRLIEAGNRPAAEWALREAARLPADARREILLRTIDRLETIEQPSMHDRLLAALAARDLIASDAAELAKRVARQSGRPEIPEAIVTAMCDLGTPEAAAFARMVRGRMAQRGESMALVSIAKTAETLTPAEQLELARIGGGGGRVEEPIQMQAAWLYLRHAKKLAKALPQLTPR
jgi:hypothetical protein